ncbi:hypothetical protein E4U57_005135 [Claviceps arundinis]|uniref:MIF4G domain-containing protein n=1 Tax=Claviceps arundinis TaxID=1623583 RepID=A0ABQ7PN76_9HYPO|nr:hypothetical protein E4U57_005135 [Claviceps arundinis]
MTSSAKSNSIPATNTSATTATSYASAAGAPQQSSPPRAPVIATGSQKSLVADSASASAAQNAKSSPPSLVNGKSRAPSAVPAVACGSSTNGSGVDHSMNSLTMAVNTPNQYPANAGASSGIQFGFSPSPAMAHSTPQAGNAAPIAIPGAGNQRIPSPANSPSPIPQPSASGGRPPSGLQQPSGQMTFGSFGDDGERHMRQGSSVHSNSNGMGSQGVAHFRHESNHSLQGENRGNYPPSGGRGRSYNPQNNHFNNQMGYPPNNQYRNSHGQGRGVPPPFQPQNRVPYGNSPQNTRSPAMVPSMPNTPNMPPATMQSNLSMQTPPQYHYPPPMAPQHQQVQPPFSGLPDKLSFKSLNKKSRARREHAISLQSGRQLDSIRELHGNDASRPQRCVSQRPESHCQNQQHSSNGRRVVSSGVVKLSAQCSTQTAPRASFQSSSLDLSPENGGFELALTMKYQNFGYPPQQHDQYGRPLSMPYAYNNVPPYMAPPQANSPSYNQQFASPYHQHSNSMSRSPSQSERPSSATQQQNQQPLVVSSVPQPSNAAGKGLPNSFVKPRKSAAIPIKNAAGEVVDTSTLKPSASPAPSSHQSKTPPAVVSSMPTPPAKSATPSHGRSDGTAPPKTAKEIQDELKEKIKQATSGAANEAAKAKDPVAPKKAAAETPAETPAEVPAETPVKAPVEVPVQAPVKAPVETPVKAEAPVEAPAEKKETPVEAVAEAEVAAPKPVANVEEAKKSEQKPTESTAAGKDTEDAEDEMERMIREIEEAEALREKQELEHKKRADAQKAEAKKKAEEDLKNNAANQDEKLREAEREMERLEEEKERQRKEAESSGKTMSVAEALAAARAGKDADSSNVDSVANKLAGLKISAAGEDDKSAAGDAAGQKRGAKPAALNLAPLNSKPIESPQPSAALQSLKSARFLQVMDQEIYPTGIKSPNPALNAAVTKKGKSFKYDAGFLLQFQKVFTEQPSVEFHQQVKSLIGDGDRSARTQTPRQPSNRGSGAFSMGTFNAPPGRTLPPGTSSEQRLAMSSGTIPRPSVGSIGSFRGPGGAFPGGNIGSRTASQPRSGVPNSPSARQGSRSTRGSRRDYNGKDVQAAKTMPLTAGMDIKPIAVSSGGWKPTSIGNRAATSTPTGYFEPEMVQRKVKAALNKMTPEKFDRIADQILEIAGQSKDESDGRTLRQVIQLTFEKATDEAHWASMYAKFCKRMLENMSADVRDERIKDKFGNIVSGGALFRKYLLNRCQEDFERGWTTHLPAQPNGEDDKETEGGADASKKGPGDAALLSDEYYIAAAAKRRGLGLVQFIGELFKLGMLTERIMHECVHKLVDYKGVPDEAEIESLSKLLRTIGANLDSTEKGRPMMNAYFQRIQTMLDLPELQSRMRFMLMDVVDLRRNNWVSKEANKGPKTLDEVRAEAEAAAAKAQESSARNNTRGGPGGRLPMGRGDVRNFSGGGYAQQTSNHVGMDDLRRLKGSASRTSSQNPMLGPGSMFSSRSNSGRRLGPGGSLGRPGEDSGASSRTGTPPVVSSNTNTFSLLANMETEHPASPPSAGPSPLMAKAMIDEKKESE